MKKKKQPNYSDELLAMITAVRKEPSTFTINKNIQNEINMFVIRIN